MLLRPALRAAALAFPLLASACAADPGPTRDLTLRHVVLYQNGIGYFERAGVLREDRLRLRLREREMDDVLKTLVVVEQTRSGGRKPSTVTALLPQAQKKTERDPEASTWLDVVLSPRPLAELSIAYAVPTAAWKSAYRVVLPDDKSKQHEALLQAWALVDNVSEEDWTDIQLTLATGAPLTFSTHMRDVRFVNRPEVSFDRFSPGARGPVFAERTAGADRDHDGIPDEVDACPDVPGASTPDPRANGCPEHRRIIVSSNQLQILEQVTFAANSDIIGPAAIKILDEVVMVLRAHTEIRRIRIAGHTSANEHDPSGLSARRAASVRGYLIVHGIDAGRLVVESFGASRPIADNSTEGGRAKSRRVQFQIDGELANSEATVAPVAPTADPAKMSESAGASAAQRGGVGSFRYDITHSVTLPKMSTTMVTIVNEYIPGEDILLFRPDGSVPGSAEHPFHAARIVNRSGFGLQAGPVAIFGGGTFVGEGLIESLSRGQTAYIPYGLDADVSVEVETRRKRSPVQVLAAAKGVLSVEDEIAIFTTYRVTTGDRPSIRLFLRHARSRGYEVQTTADMEMTNETLLVPVPAALASGAKSVVEVEERQKVRDELVILATDPPRLAAYLAGSKLAADAEKKLREVVALRGEVERLVREMDSLRARLSDLGQRSAELRESLRSIEKTPRAAALQQKLLDRLAEATKDGEELSRKLTDDGAALSEARARIAEGLRELAIEEKAPPAPAPRGS